MPETLSTRPKRRMFPGHADQIAHARDFTRRALGACPVLDEAILLVSELASNAIEHTATGNGAPSTSPSTSATPGSSPPLKTTAPARFLSLAVSTH